MSEGSVSSAANSPRRSSNNARAVATLGRFLSDDGWRPRPEGSQAFVMVYQGGSGPLELRAAVGEGDQLTVLAVAPAAVPAARRAAAAEYVARANCGLYVGSLDLDMDNGEVVTRVGLDFEGEPLSPRLIRNALAIVVRLGETYLPGLAQVSAGAEPRAALAAAEGRAGGAL